MSEGKWEIWAVEDEKHELVDKRYGWRREAVFIAAKLVAAHRPNASVFLLDRDKVETWELGGDPFE